MSISVNGLKEGDVVMYTADDRFPEGCMTIIDHDPHWIGVVVGTLGYGDIVMVRPMHPALRERAKAFRGSQHDDWFQVSCENFEKVSIAPGLFNETFIEVLP